MKVMQAIPSVTSAKPGVSVIIPSYRAERTLGQTLESLRSQSLDCELYEVIVVVNGPVGTTPKLIEEFREVHPTFELVWVSTTSVGAGAARNLGLALASREYVTFIDADDWVENDFLRSGLESARPDTICLLPIINWEDGVTDADNSLNARMRQLAGSRKRLDELPWALGFNACKIIPRRELEGTWYDENLKSGEDLVFFANLLNRHDLSFEILEQDSNAYVRRLTASSVSRQPESFEFNVRQRLECVQALQTNAEKSSSVGALVSAQTGFVERYMKSHPEDLDKLEAVLANLKIKEFEWNRVFDSPAQDLVFAYCFPPFSDTSAIVAAKIIAARARRADVISADLSSVRGKDETLMYLAGRWVGELTTLDVPASFSNWEAISQFAELAVETAIVRQNKRTVNYETVYSRAMWSGSHVAGALFKLRNLSIRWVAEFSDPLRFGVDGTQRSGSLTNNQTTRELRGALKGVNLGFEIETLFDLIEASTMLLADELIFTNPRQMEYTLADYSPEVRPFIESKCTVRPHPTPHASLYGLVETNYRFDPDRVNIAYFGSFYLNRGLSDVFIALMNAPVSVRANTKLHVFTSNVEAARDEVAGYGLSRSVTVNEYLPYLEFLNATTKADVLLVNDVKTNDGDKNPFLPSKVSDYLGSGSRIWGITDEDSPLSSISLEYRSEVGNSPAALSVLIQIYNDFQQGF